MAVAETSALNGTAPQMETSPSAVSRHFAILANALGAPIGFAHRHVAPHLPSFLAKYLHLSVGLQSAESDTDMIETGFDWCSQISLHSDHYKLVHTKLVANSCQLIDTDRLFTGLWRTRKTSLFKQVTSDQTYQ